METRPASLPPSSTGTVADALFGRQVHPELDGLFRQAGPCLNPGTPRPSRGFFAHSTPPLAALRNGLQTQSKFLAAMLILLVSVCPLAAQSADWTTREGVSQRATFVGLTRDGQAVTLLLPDGSTVHAPLDHLDDASRARAHELEKARQEALPRVPTGRIYLEDGFESSRWWSEWKMKNAPSNCERVRSDPENGMTAPHSGRHALRVRINQGRHDGTSISYYFRREPENVYFRYYLLLGNDWHYHGKMPGFAGTYDKVGWGGKRADGKNGWSARGSGATHGERFRMTTYCYHVDQQTTYGDNWQWNHPGLEKGRWYCIEQFCQLNTPGQKDGVIRAWIDGKQVFEKTNIRMRDVDKLKIERIWFNFYFGGKDTAPGTCHAYIDDVVIAEGPIGPTR